MPTEPNHKLHEALNAWAQKRRDQAGPPFEIHPATRQMLQGEVVRAFRDPSASPPSARFVLHNFWRRILLGGSCVALVVVAAGVWLRIENDRKDQAALTESNLLLFTQSASEPADQLNLPPGTEPSTMAERVRGFELGASSPGVPTQRSRGPGKGAGQANPLEPGAEPEAGRVELALSLPAPRDGLETDLFSNAPHFQIGLPRTGFEPSGPAAAPARSQSQAASAPEIAPPPRAKQEPVTVLLAAAKSAETAQSPTRGSARYFQQMAPNARPRQNFSSSSASNVLNTFEVQRFGDNLRIVDADGSVYEGAVQPAKATGQESAEVNVSNVAFAFRTAGTNKTLNQLIVFTGQFDPNAIDSTVSDRPVPESLADARPQDSARPEPLRPTAGQRAAAVSNQALGRQSFNSSNSILPGKIDGTISLGTDNQIKIEAQQIAR